MEATQMTTEKITYQITGEFPDGCEGYNVFDYLPTGADTLRFGTEAEAIQWAEQNSKGRDLDGIEPTWSARERA